MSSNNTTNTPKLSRGLRVLPSSKKPSISNLTSQEKESLTTQLDQHWKTSPRWKFTRRSYTAKDVLALRPSQGAMSFSKDRLFGIAPKCSYSHSSSTKLYKLLRSLHLHQGYSRKFFIWFSIVFGVLIVWELEYCCGCWRYIVHCNDIHMNPYQH